MDVKRIRRKKIWEDFISKQVYTSHFQSWDWGKFENTIGRWFEGYGIYDGGDLVGLIPLRRVRAKRGRYLYLRHGPIFDHSNKKRLNIFYDFIKQISKNEKYSFVRMSPLILKREKERYKLFFENLKDSQMHDIDAEKTWILSLKNREEELLANMRKNTRYYIRRARRDGVKIKKTQEMKYFDHFWNIYLDTVNRQKWLAYDKDYIKQEFKIFKQNDQIDLYLAEYDNKFIAAAFIIYYQNQGIYHHGGMLSKYRKIPSSYLIQWEAIKECKKRNLEFYNFWGISPLVKVDNELKPKPGHPWEGLTFFKMGFGGQSRDFVHAKDLEIGWKYKLVRRYERLESKIRGY